VCWEVAGWDHDQTRRQPTNWLNDLLTAYSEKQRIMAVLARQPLEDHKAEQNRVPQREQMDAFGQLYDAPPEAFADLL
jgi:hypothetical protein